MLTKCVGCGKKSNNSTDGALHRCQTCGHQQFPFELSLQKYDQSYLDEYKRRAATALGRTINTARWALVQKYIPHGQRILDWGCGAGNFIAQPPGAYHVEGYDVNPYSPYSDHELYYEWWRGVTLWDVIEHLYQPDAFLRCLKAEYIFIATPNASVSGDDITKWKHYKPEEHQHYFNELSLTWMMARAGYNVEEVSFVESTIRDPEHSRMILTTVGRRT